MNSLCHLHMNWGYLLTKILPSQKLVDIWALRLDLMLLLLLLFFSWLSALVCIPCSVLLLLCLTLRYAWILLCHHDDWLVDWVLFKWLERKLGCSCCSCSTGDVSWEKWTVSLPCSVVLAFYASSTVTVLLTAVHMHVLPQQPACLGISILFLYLATAGLIQMIPRIISVAVYSICYCADFWLVHLPVLLIIHNQIVGPS